MVSGLADSQLIVALSWTKLDKVSNVLPKKFLIKIFLHADGAHLLHVVHEAPTE